MGAQSRDLAGLHDAELASLAAGGGRAAFGELVRRHGSAVRALLRRMGADGALADDLAQDAFLAAFERVAEFRGEGTFVSWVRRIAARLYVRRWRRAARLDLLADPPRPIRRRARARAPRPGSTWTRPCAACPRPSACVCRYVTAPAFLTRKRPKS